MSKRKEENQSRRNLAVLKQSDKFDAKGIKSFEKQIAEYELKAKKAKTESAKNTYLGLAATSRKNLASYKEKLAGISTKREELKTNIRSRLKVSRKND